MPTLTCITGCAGTGKTTKLLHKAGDLASKAVIHPHQRLLAMAVMHGARRRLETSLQEHPVCSGLPRVVTTIDSFALQVVNRWRTAVGIRLPISSARTSTGAFAERFFKTEASFEEVLKLATDLLQCDTVARIVAANHPLIIIDEFQDCHGAKLNLIRQLAARSTIAVAADDFQLLDSSVAGCPALSWIDALAGTPDVERVDLVAIHRTANAAIIRTAQALRSGVRSTKPTVEVKYGAYGLIAWQILNRIVLCDATKRWNGTCALITPAKSPVIIQILESINKQLAKSHKEPMKWRQTTSQEDDTAQLLAELGAQPGGTAWASPVAPASKSASAVCDQVGRIARLRGLHPIPHEFVAGIAERAVHARHSYPVGSPRHIVTSVHSAKNREFDNVFVLWPYSATGSLEYQRRLLYNAVTRAKKHCIVLVPQKAENALALEVLKVLDTPRPVASPKPKAESKAR